MSRGIQRTLIKKIFFIEAFYEKKKDYFDNFFIFFIKIFYIFLLKCYQNFSKIVN